MSTNEQFIIDMVRAYIKGALDFPAGLEKGERLQGYESALQGVLMLVNSLELPKTPEKTG